MRKQCCKYQSATNRRKFRKTRYSGNVDQTSSIHNGHKRSTGEYWTNTLPESVMAKEEGKRGRF